MPDTLVLKPAPDGGSGFQLWRHHSRLPSSRSIDFNEIGDAAKASIRKAWGDRGGILSGC